MKKQIVVLMLMISTCLFAGNHEKLPGTWKANLAKLKESPEFKKASKDPNQQFMVNMMLAMVGKMKMVFTKTKLDLSAPGPDGKTKTESGTYKVISDKDKTIEINAISDKGEKEILVIKFVDDKNIVMGPKNEKGLMGSIPFVKE